MYALNVPDKNIKIDNEYVKYQRNESGYYQ